MNSGFFKFEELLIFCKSPFVRCDRLSQSIRGPGLNDSKPFHYTLSFVVGLYVLNIICLVPSYVLNERFKNI